MLSELGTNHVNAGLFTGEMRLFTTVAEQSKMRLLASQREQDHSALSNIFRTSTLLNTRKVPRQELPGNSNDHHGERISMSRMPRLRD